MLGAASHSAAKACLKQVPCRWLPSLGLSPWRWRQVAIIFKAQIRLCWCLGEEAWTYWMLLQSHLSWLVFFRAREIWSLGLLPKMPCLLLTCPVHAWYSLDFVNFRSFLVSICSLPVSLGGGTGHMGIQLAKAGLQTNHAFFFSASIPAIQMVYR